MVAAASNTRYALEEIKNVYVEETGVKLNLVFASSGKLTSQIINGAPYHVFLSANKAFADTLFRKGYAQNLPKAVIQGSLIVVSNKEYDLKIKSISLEFKLMDLKFKFLQKESGTLMDQTFATDYKASMLEAKTLAESLAKVNWYFNGKKPSEQNINSCLDTADFSDACADSSISFKWGAVLRLLDMINAP